MKKAILIVSAALTFSAPAYAQVRFNTNKQNSNPTMVRIPPSSLPAQPLITSTQSAYPKPIRRDYDPNFIDPTNKNPNLRQR